MPDGAEQPQDPFVVACVPAFNEEGRIASVIVRARRRVDAVVVCDDGSGDLTGEIAGGLGAVVVRHGRTLGYGASLGVCSRRLFGLGRIWSWRCMQMAERDINVGGHLVVGASGCL